MQTRRPRQYTYDLFGEQDETRSELRTLGWPDAKRFPLNLDSQKPYSTLR